LTEIDSASFGTADGCGLPHRGIVFPAVRADRIGVAFESDRKPCPYCGELIAAAATKCRFCGEWLSGPDEPALADEVEEPLKAQTLPPGEAGSATTSGLRQLGDYVENRQMALAIGGLVIGIFVLVLISIHRTGNSASTSASASSGGSAEITMLHGRGSDNSCTESDSEARIYVSFTLRNSGDKDGTVNPWATFDYSDGGNSTESYETNYGHELTVPAHSEVDATFHHTFNPQQHSMIHCAGYPDLNIDTGGYNLPMS
jgi:hypothetical protein